MNIINNTNNITPSEINSPRELQEKNLKEGDEFSIFENYSEEHISDGEPAGTGIPEEATFKEKVSGFFNNLSIRFGRNDSLKEIQVNSDNETDSEISSKPELRNEQIDNYKQNTIQDCWFLSALTSLENTKKGADIIKNSIDYTDDGIKITFNGLNKRYTISNEEIKQAKSAKENNDDLKYTEGDDDVLAFELALERLSKYIADNKIDIKGNASDFEQSDIINGNSPEFAMEILGINTEKCETKIQKPQELETFLNNRTDSSLNENTASILCSNDAEIVTDINGKTKELKEMHTYGVKSISKKDNTITFSDPWNTKEEITLSMETIKKLLNYDTISLRTFSLE